MRTSTASISIAALLLILTGCNLGDELSEPCIDVSGPASTDLGFPVVIPDPVNVSGAGALPSWVDLGTIQGTLSSVLTDAGEGGPGTQYWELMHYFVDKKGNAFWTEDKAVCEPIGGNQTGCKLEDEMTIVGGTGLFANATGTLYNSGSATITDPTFQTTPFGSVTGYITGRICADGL